MFLLIVIIQILFFILRPNKAAAGWFNDSWAFRQKLTFGNTGSADSNKKVKFDIDTSALTTDKLQADCDDIRFTDLNGKILPFYLDSAGGACDTNSTDYYVLMPEILAGTNTIYTYYGNPSAVSGGMGAQFSQATFSPTSGPSTNTEEKGPSTVMYLKLDDGTDNSCTDGVKDICDSTTLANDGDRSGAKWMSEDMCVSGKCLWFDGTDDIITVDNADSIDFDLGINDGFTISTWIRVNSDGENSTGEIIDKGGHFYLRTDNEGSDGYVDLEAFLNLTTTDPTLNITDGVSLNRWHHVAVNYTDDADDDITIYIDGVLKGTGDGSGSPTGTDSSNLLLGGDSANNYHGFVDEVKIYPFEKSATDIKTEYQIPSLNHGATATIGGNNKSLSDGLNGYWKLDLLNPSAGTSGPTKIDDPGDPDDQLGGRNVVRTSSGVLYAAINDGGFCEVWKSSDGLTWVEQDSSNKPGCLSDQYISLSINSTNILQIIYGAVDLGINEIQYVTFSTSTDTFGSPETINSIGAGTNLSCLEITTDSNDVPHLVYCADEGSSNVQYYSNRVGGTWNTVTVNTEASGGGYRASITINEDNIPEFVLIYQVTSTLTAFLGNQNNATSFTSQDLDTSATAIFSISIAVDSSGNTWIAYIDDNGANDYVMLIKHDDASAWSSWNSAVHNSTIGRDPSIAIDGTNVYVFYQHNLGIAYDVYASGSWQGGTILNTGSNSEVKVRWSLLNNVSYATYGFDYLYSDNTDVYWANLSIGTETATNIGDSSGNNQSLTNNNSVTFVTGKFNIGSEHVPASSQYLSYGSTINDVKSVSFWVNPDNTSNYFISLTAGAYITSSSGTISATGFTNPKIFVNGIESSSLSADTWQLITVTSDTAINANQFYIGRQSGNYMDGTLDEIRLYNRLLANSEIITLHQFAPNPVGYWKLDENKGSTAFDSSSNANDATLNNSRRWSEGKYGSGFSLNGSNQQAIRLDDSDFDFTDDADMTIALWFKHLPPVGQEVLISKYNEAGYKVIIESDGDLTCALDYDSTWSPTDSVTSTLATYDDNKWHHLACVKNGASNLSLYIDGTYIAQDSSISATNTMTNSDPLYIGIDADGVSNDYTGSIDDIKIYNYARSEKQIIADMNGGHPAPGSPVGSYVAYWKFDEGETSSFQGQDSSQYNNDLSLSGEGLYTSSGKYGGAYEGTDNGGLSRTDDEDFDFEANADFSISAWFKRNTISNEECILVKGASPIGYILAMDSDGDVGFGIGDQNSISLPEDSIGGNLGKNYDDNNWHHVVAVKNGLSSIELYVDGLKIASNTSLAVTGTLANNGTLRIAECDGLNNTNEFLGYLDEMQVFRSALNSEQIKVLYNHSSSISLGALGTSSTGTSDNSRERSFCIPEDTTSCAIPVAYYPLDSMSVNARSEEKSGTNTSELTLTAGVALAPGKYSQALNFNGASDSSGGQAEGDDDTQLNMNSTDDFTFSAWFNTDTISADKTILKKGPRVVQPTDKGYVLYIRDANDTVQFRISDGSNYCFIETNTVINLSTWYHVAVVIDRDSAANSNIYLNGVADKNTITCSTTFTNVGDNSNTAKFVISPNNGSEEFDGRIDDVRVYNYIRTPAQRMWDMNYGAPIGHWKFDECQGTTAYDSTRTSNNMATGYNGTIGYGASGNTTTGTCNSGTTTEMWNDGTNGKRNSSIGLDGVDDYVNYGDLDRFDFGADQDFTIALWVKTNIDAVTDFYPTVITKEGGSPRNGYSILANTAQFSNIWRGEIYIAGTLHQCAGTKDITDNLWHHLVLQRNGSNLLVYEDGKLANTCAASSSTIANAINLSLGIREDLATYPLAGQLDDVRIYNYALTAHQIRVAMNDGAVNFAPLTGTP